MVWWKWKCWRFAWSLNPGTWVSDSSGRWCPIVGPLTFRYGKPRPRIWESDPFWDALSEDEKHAAVFEDNLPRRDPDREYQRCHRCEGLWHPEPDLSECRCGYYEDYDNAP